MQSAIAQLASFVARDRRTARPLLWLAVGLPVAVFSGFAWFDYHVERARARDHIITTADVLAEHAQTIVETADLALARVIDRLQAPDWTSIRTSRSTYDFLVALQQQLPQFESVFLVAPDGANVVSSRAFPMPPFNDSDRDYFQRALHGDHGPFVSGPFRGHLAGTYAFVITRPILDNGRFDGLVGVTISAAYFETFYKAVVDHPNTSSAALVRSDGEVLVKFPARASGSNQPGLPNPQAKAIAAGAAEAQYQGESTIDGHQQIAAFKQLHHWPLIATYAMDRALYLREWYLHLGFFAVSALLIGLLLALVERLMLWQATQQHETLRQLVDETARRQQAEAALQESQKLEALGRLTGGVAHDFNNLLAAILGCLELLQKHVSEPRALRLLSTARQAAERGAGLTAQMLAFSRRKEVVVIPLDVNATIQGLDSLLRQAIGPEIQLHLVLDNDLGSALGDQSQLEVALLNLAVNARDAMPAGGDLTIATAAVAVGTQGRDIPGVPPGSYVRVSVADTGQGMSEAVRARAFEPFFTTKGPGKGTGLGLSMVFGFAAAIGGSITLDSELGHGTTISLYMPAAAKTDAAEKPLVPQDPEIVHPARTGSRRILLVDDDDAVRATASVMLEDLADEIVMADSAHAALEILRSDRGFDLLMLDFAMPAMNGSELAQQIRAIWPDAPILFVTGYVENDALRPWRERGVPTLNKPFSHSSLAAALATALERAPACTR